MNEIYELKEMLMKELEEYGRKGEMSAGSLEIVDKLAHAVKNLCKIIEAAEEEEYSERGGSYDGGGNMGGQSMRGNSYRYSRNNGGGGGGSYRNSYNRRSYARGRGSNARRDSRGRYSSDGSYEQGYSRAEDDMDDIVSEMRELMIDLPQEKQQEVRRFIDEIERMDK